MMSIETKKLHLVQHILLTRDERLLDELEDLIRKSVDRSDLALEESITSGLHDIELGRMYAADDVKAYISKKYGL